MAHPIQGTNISTAWLEAMEYLIEENGKASHLIVTIPPADGAVENPSIRSLFDNFLEVHESPGVRRIRKVADTIFPIDFYKPSLGAGTQAHLYKMQGYARRFEKRSIPGGTYFDRLVEWPDIKNGKMINQLETKIRRLKGVWERNVRNGSAYELALTNVEEESATNNTLGSEELRVQDPCRDNSIMGFPCMSHISLTLFNGQLDMTAVYRNQYFMTKAYGNYVGLVELLQFISNEVGCKAGELMCIATHADAEFAELGKRKIIKLVEACRECIADTNNEALFTGLERTQ